MKPAPVSACLCVVRGLPTRLVALLMVLCLWYQQSGPHVRGLTLPSPRFGMNCSRTDRKCRLNMQAEITRQSRLQRLRIVIAAKLGKSPGSVTPIGRQASIAPSGKSNRRGHKIPAVIFRKAIQFIENRGSRSGDYAVSGNPQGYSAYVSEIVTFSEEASNVSASNSHEVIQFSIGGKYPNGQLQVDSADVWVLIRYKMAPNSRKQENRRKKPAAITLKVYRLYRANVVEKTGKAMELVDTYKFVMKHTSWQNLTLPHRMIQDLLESEDKRLHLMIKCEGCGKTVHPVLVKKKKRNSMSQRAKRAGRQPRRSHGKFRKRKHKKRDHRKREKLNKRRPFMIIRTKLKSRVRYNRRRRKYRSLGHCHKGNHGGCCVERFRVNFRELGWDNWVLYPKHFYANRCAGNCSTHFIHSHTHHSYLLKNLANKRQPSCCVPTKFSPISLFILDDNNNIMKTNVPNMVVEECGCA